MMQSIKKILLYGSQLNTDTDNKYRVDLISTLSICIILRNLWLFMLHIAIKQSPHSSNI